MKRCSLDGLAVKENDVQTRERLERKLRRSVLSGEYAACGILTEMERGTREREKRERSRTVGRTKKEICAQRRTTLTERNENVVANKKCA